MPPAQMEANAVRAMTAETDVRPCPTCGASVTLTPARIKRSRYTCQPCTNKAVRAWSLRHPDRSLASARKRARAYQLRHPERMPSKAEKKAYDREWTLRRKYDIGVEQYDVMLAAQGGRCAICETTTPGGKGFFHVDHSHATGRIRGLLCSRCNLGIGSLYEDPLILGAAIDYLLYYGMQRTA